MVPELTVTDFAISKRFYVDILGFSIMNERSSPKFVYLSLGEVQIMLEQYQEDGWNTGELIYPLGRGVNFQIEVDDIEQILNRLNESNIPLFQDIQSNDYEVGGVKACQREFLVQDPDGYLLRFNQYIG